MPRPTALPYLADPRFPGGTSTALISEIRALARVGVRPGLLPVRSPLLAGGRDFHPGLIDQIEQGSVDLIDPRQPVACRIAVIHHPQCFSALPAQPLLVAAERILLVIHHPPSNGLGQPEYDLPQILRNIEETLSSKVVLAPVSPIVRRHLSGILDPDTELLPVDWCNVADFGVWPQRAARPGNARIVIGRHTRPQLSKWPDTLETALQVYPEGDRFEIRMLGAPPGLPNRYGRLPGNWRLMPFRHDGVADFLKSLDFYVYYHGTEWIEAFGYNVLEAVASGVPAILPPQFEPVFGSAAIYAEPAEVQNKILALNADTAAYTAHAKAARTSIEQSYGLERLPERLDKILPGWRTEIRSAVASERPIRRALMISSNGVGLGHITRLLAIAERFDRALEVAFLTMSPGFKVIQDRGYLAQFIPFHRYTGAIPLNGTSR